MTKTILLIIVVMIFCLTVDHCQAVNDTDATDNQTETIVSKPFVYHGRYYRRVRRQYEDPTANLDTASTVLSILPLDRIGAIIGQIMSTGLKEMLNPDVGKKLVNVLENQAPLLLTSLFTNLYSTLSVPGRPAPSATSLTSSSVSINNNGIKQLSNSSTSGLMNAIRPPPTK